MTRAHEGLTQTREMREDFELETQKEDQNVNVWIIFKWIKIHGIINGAESLY